MPDPTPTPAASGAGMLSAGIVVTIGGTTLENCCSTPDMGKEPDKVDVTNFGCMTKKAYIAGLEDTDTLNFDFYPTDQLPSDANNASCTVEYPNGTEHSFTGDARFFMLAAAPGEALKARCSVVVSDWGESGGSSSNNG